MGYFFLVWEWGRRGGILRSGIGIEKNIWSGDCADKNFSNIYQSFFPKKYPPVFYK